MKRLIKKADEDHFNITTDYVDSPSGIVFNTGWDAIENDNITKQKYDTGINIGFKFEEDLDYPVYDLRS